MSTVAKLLAEAKTLAADQATRAARQERYAKAREWSALASEIDRLLRDALAAMAS